MKEQHKLTKQKSQLSEKRSGRSAGKLKRRTRKDSPVSQKKDQMEERKKLRKKIVDISKAKRRKEFDFENTMSK